jgi:probable HAF family extracellular repeat protein
MHRHKEVVSSHWGRIVMGVAVLGIGQGVLAETALAQAQYQAVPLGSLGTDSISTGINETGEVSGYSNLQPSQPHAFLYGKPPGSAQPVLIDLGTLGGQTSYGYAINDASSVVGTSETSQGLSHAFIYKNGVLSDLHGSLGGDTSSATGINDADHVVGTFRIGSSASQAFLLAGQTLITIGTLGGPETRPAAVNDSDQVVGTSDLANGVDRAFLFNRTDGVLTDLGTLGGTFSYAYDISDSGFVTGQAALTDDAGSRAFLYKSDLGMINLGTLQGGGVSRGRGVNNAGDVVGFALASDFSLKAVVYTDGQLWDLNELIDPAQPLPDGVQLTDAVGINDQGWIVAEGYDASLDQSEAYLLIPN